jgi:hypothetical protein
MPDFRHRLTRRLLTLLTMSTVALTPATGLLLAAPPVTAPVLSTVDAAPIGARYALARAAMRAAGGVLTGQEGQFLLFDPGGRGRVAQVFGDLPAAGRIAILVPGAGNRAANFWRGVGGARERSPAVQAAELHEAAGGSVAVIAWLGYDTPLAVAEAAGEDLARTGAVALERFVTGLLTVRPQATIALFGHSYGSTVIGLAAPHLPPAVTDIAVVGSPGMGVRSVAELRTSARVWAGEAAGDWVRWVPGGRLFGMGHGTRPVDPEFGAQTFSTAGVDGHDHYFHPGTDSLDTLARIAVGASPPSTPGRPIAGSGSDSAPGRTAAGAGSVPALVRTADGDGSSSAWGRLAGGSSSVWARLADGFGLFAAPGWTAGGFGSFAIPAAAGDEARGARAGTVTARGAGARP